MKNKIAITTGDFNGIGAEITIKALKFFNPEDFILISNREILNFYGGQNLNCEIVEIPFDGEITPGKITKESGEFCYQSIKKACEISPKAIVTAPISKEALHLGCRFYNGHTELLEKFLGQGKDKAEMLFVANNFRVLLLTRHCALKDVNITKELIIEKTERLISELPIKNPKLAICGLNPHAGENGILGTEELEIIIPAIEILRQRGIEISMPKPSDTLFVPASKAYKEGTEMPYDCYLAMYHDQGLIPMKVIAGEKAVNVTIGLNTLRTSPSHGTAFDIAGKNCADFTPMVEAIKVAIEMTN